MFRSGGRVVHGEYGLGTFKGVFGSSVRIAIVEFSRGARCFVLPSRGLVSLRGELKRDEPAFKRKREVYRREGEEHV